MEKLILSFDRNNQKQVYKKKTSSPECVSENHPNCWISAYLFISYFSIWYDVVINPTCYPQVPITTIFNITFIDFVLLAFMVTHVTLFDPDEPLFDATTGSRTEIVPLSGKCSRHHQLLHSFFLIFVVPPTLKTFRLVSTRFKEYG